MNLPDNQTKLERVQIKKMFNDLLFDHDDPAGELSPKDEIFYHRFCAHIDQQDKLSKYIPSPPAQLMALLQELEQENTNFDKIQDIIEKDLALLGEIIRISNSPLYRLRTGGITSIEKSIAFLGIVGVMQIAAAVMLRRIVNIESSHYQAFGKALWKHCLKSAEGCRVAGNPDESFKNYILGLIHDIGKASIFTCFIDLLNSNTDSNINQELVLKKIMLEQSSWLSALIAGEWGMSDHYLLTLNEYSQLPDHGLGEDEHNIMLPGTRILECGSLGAQIHTLIENNLIGKEDGITFLLNLGFSEKRVDTLFTRFVLFNASVV